MVCGILTATTTNNILRLGNLLTIVPEIRTVLGRLKRELLDPVLVAGNTKKTSETQTSSPEPQRHRNPSVLQPIPGFLPNSTPDVLRIQPRYFSND